MLKNNKIKKYVSSLLAIAAVACSMSLSMFAYADGDVAINSANFKDDIFREIVEEYLDPDHDGYLSQSERNEVKLIDVSGYLEAEYGSGTHAEISDLAGIEYFPAVRTLRVGAIGLERLNVYPLVALTSLTCQGNYLTELNLLNNEELVELNCAANNIKGLQLALNTKLKKLICFSNEIKSIDLSKNTELQELSIFQNELSTLDLSKNTQLLSLNCSNNHLMVLDLSANPLLGEVVEESIGNQTIQASANYSADDGSIYVDIEIPNSSRIVSTSIDRVEEVGGETIHVKGYDGTSFVTYDPDALLEGIVYYYNVNLEDAENMSVCVDVARDFFVVRYYESKDTNKLGEEIVNGGNAATFELENFPMCKRFVQWDQDLSNITKDVDTYAIWEDDHNIQITLENGVVNVACTNGCGFNERYTFADSINARTGDINYVSYLDVNSDGIINAKDFARLLKGQL
jgi:hypothetical protein